MKKTANLECSIDRYTLPLFSYEIIGTFDQPGATWSPAYHAGLDFGAPSGSLIKAVHSGRITEASWSGPYGYRTILTLADGTALWYCHQSSMRVRAGQTVAVGEIIGRVGMTGNAKRPHLHIEVHSADHEARVDPFKWLEERGLAP
ncbi:M23 family metallopeptidase [Streptomyces sp. 1222.5]|uniref:M23 family metallopeptidase n=1 Tax=Streptomyces sp. 1222.5 TaxID=1881026 RepID=UPI003EBA2436